MGSNRLAAAFTEKMNRQEISLLSRAAQVGSDAYGEQVLVFQLQEAGALHRPPPVEKDKPPADFTVWLVRLVFNLIRNAPQDAPGGLFNRA